MAGERSPEVSERSFTAKRRRIAGILRLSDYYLVHGSGPGERVMSEQVFVSAGSTSEAPLDVVQLVSTGLSQDLDLGAAVLSPLFSPEEKMAEEPPPSAAVSAPTSDWRRAIGTIGLVVLVAFLLGPSSPIHWAVRVDVWAAVGGALAFAVFGAARIIRG